MKDLRRRTQVLTVLLGLCVVARLFALIAHAATLRTFDPSLLDPTAVTGSDVADTIWFVTAIVFLWWVHSSYKNFVIAGFPNLEQGPVWAVVGFLIPLVNVYHPYATTKELWVKTAVLAQRPESEALQPKGIGAWWLTVLAGQISERIGSNLLERSAAAAGTAWGSPVQLGGDLLLLVATIWAVFLFRRIFQYQRAWRPLPLPTAVGATTA